MKVTELCPHCWQETECDNEYDMIALCKNCGSYIVVCSNCPHCGDGCGNCEYEEEARQMNWKKEKAQH